MTSGQGVKAVTAKCSALYDIQKNIVLDAVLDNFSVRGRLQTMMGISGSGGIECT